MPSDVLPNDVISNLCVLIVVPVMSSFVIRTKHRLCDTYSRRPRQLTVDQHAVVSSNLLAFCLIVIWSAAAPGNASCHVERMVVLDVLLVMHVQRWLEREIFVGDTAPYYEPGPLSLAQRKRRVKIILLLTTLSCAFSAAVSMVVAKDENWSSTTHYDDSAKEYWFLIIGLPAIHSSLRTLVLDTQGCKKRSAAAVEQSLDIATNEFTITDEEDEDVAGHDDSDCDENVVAI